MEDKDPDQTPRPGVPEALDPTLGNGSLWENNPHQFNLKSVDVVNQLDRLLLDDSERQMIIEQWNGTNGSSSEENPPKELVEKDTLKAVDEIEVAVPKEKQIITRNKVKKSTAIEWAEDQEPFVSEPGDQKINTPEIVTQPEEIPAKAKVKPIEKVGKRIRKVVKKARDESEAAPEPDLTGSVPPSGDPQLSPFTHWLKGLRGSEYVHPYEDDYGLDQMSSMARGGVSETFADLLAIQGYKDKAIEMYMQLMEKYPEKSSFFAAKIEAIK